MAGLPSRLGRPEARGRKHDDNRNAADGRRGGAQAVRLSSAPPDNSMGRRWRVVRLHRRNIQLFQSVETTCGWRRAAKTLQIYRPRFQPRLVARQKVSRRLARQTARRRDTDYKPALARAEQ